MASAGEWIGGALLLALVATAGVLLLDREWGGGRDLRYEGGQDLSGAWNTPRRQQSRKQEKRVARIANRRASKDARQAAVRAARSREMAQQRLLVSDAQRREEIERVKMRRVEQYQKLQDAMAYGVRVVVDLSFLEMQTPRERQSVFKQLGCFYGYLKQCPLDSLLSLRLSSCGSPEAAALCQQHGLVNWKIWHHDASFDRIYCADDLVILSPDAQDVLEELDASRIYVVGAIADRTVRKGETVAMAASKRLHAMRLPVRDHLAGVRTHVLNIDAVLVALNEFANHRDWSRAFTRAIPKRVASGRRGKKKQLCQENDGLMAQMS